jgi:enoyl-CoA hydratase/carnithine racemase
MSRPTSRAGVTLEVKDGVAWLILARSRGNRIDPTAAQALCDRAEEIELDDDVALVVVGARGKAFCLGEDGEVPTALDWIGAIGKLTRPVVAAINGDAVAEGCELALACDLRLASTKAVLSLPQINEGRLPSHGATQRLPRLIGRTRALEMLLSGRGVPAREALAMGLVSLVAPPRQFQSALQKEVAALCRKGPLALRLAKEAVTKGLDVTFEQGVRLEHDLYVLLQTTSDRAEGTRAFLEKRRPLFRGR